MRLAGGEAHAPRGGMTRCRGTRELADRQPFPSASSCLVAAGRQAAPLESIEKGRERVRSRCVLKTNLALVNVPLPADSVGTNIFDAYACQSISQCKLIRLQLPANQF